MAEEPREAYHELKQAGQHALLVPCGALPLHAEILCACQDPICCHPEMVQEQCWEVCTPALPMRYHLIHKFQAAHLFISNKFLDALAPIVLGNLTVNAEAQ